MDLVDTAFGVHIGLGRIPTTSEDTAFHFSVEENMFDACQDLSRVVIDGMNGSLSEPAGTGASHNQAVVLFRGKEVVTDPLPMTMSRVQDVTRTASDAITVSYGDAREGAAAGVTHTYDVGYHVGEDGSVEVEDVGDEPLPDEPFTRIDLRAGPMAGHASVNPMGNAHGTPYAEELEDGNYVVPVSDDLELQCVFDRAGTDMTCRGQGEHDWVDHRDTAFTEFQLGYMPATVRPSLDDWAEVEPTHTLSEDSMTLVGSTVVDLTEDGKAYFRSGESEMWITPDDYGPGEARWFEDMPTSSGGTCGPVDSGEFPALPDHDVVVDEGSVDCDEALEVFEEYLATPPDADHGNANIREFGDWTCAMPTARSSQETNTAASCTNNTDSTSVKIPAES